MRKKELMREAIAQIVNGQYSLEDTVQRFYHRMKRLTNQNQKTTESQLFGQTVFYCQIFVELPL